MAFEMVQPPVRCSKTLLSCCCKKMILAPKLQYRIADARCGASSAPAFLVFADTFTDAPLSRTEPRLTLTNQS